MLKGIIQTYKLGVNLQLQELLSGLNALQSDQTISPVNFNALNKMQWQRASLYSEGLYEYESKNEKLKASLTLPLSFKTIHYKDAGNTLNEKLEKLYIDPRASLKYQTGIENYLQLTYYLKQELGGLEEVYNAPILKNYRSLVANDAPVSETKNQTAALAFNYRKAMTFFFFNLQASYSHINLNTISSSVISNDLQQRTALLFPNEVNTLNFKGNISKYYFDWRTTFSAGFSWSENNAVQIQNQELLPIESRNKMGKLGLQTKINHNISFGYTLLYNQLNTAISDHGSKDISYKQINQQGELNLTLLRNVFVKLSAEHLYTRQSGQNKISYLFSDLIARYKVMKINTDFEFGMNNLANVKRYKTVYLSANSFNSATFQIPGRMALLKATLNF